MEIDSKKALEIFSVGFRCGETRREISRPTDKYATQAEIEQDALPIIKNMTGVQAGGSNE